MKKRIFSTVLITAVTALIGIILVTVTLNGMNNLPHARIQNRVAETKGHTVGELTEFIDFNVLFDVSFLAECEDISIKNIKITPTLTNENFFSLEEIEIEGEALSETDIKSGAKKAVISELLADKLYKNNKAVGKKLNINGDKFAICGVYKESSDILCQCSRDNKNRVFIPYSATDYKDITADTVIYENSSANVLISLLCAKDYKGVNLISKEHTLENFIHFMYIVLYFLLLTVSIRIIIFLFRQIKARYKEELRANYWRTAIKENLGYIIARIVCIIAIITGLVVLLFTVNFSIYVQPVYMAKDNIFDVVYYISRIVEMSQQGNSTLLAGYMFHQNLYALTFTADLFLIILFAIMTIVTYKSISRLIKYCRNTD